ncbi:MAG TPA: sulfite exporter TauE/SafE family protein [Polyangia bacterium]
MPDFHHEPYWGTLLAKSSGAIATYRTLRNPCVSADLLPCLGLQTVASMYAHPGLDDLAIFFGGLCAGVMNSVAGGGTLVSYPILLWAGRDPILANATNALALWPGSLAGAWGFRREIARLPRLLKFLVPAAVLGGLVGGWLLLATPSKVFSAFVPYLILFATLVLAAKSVLTRLGRQPTSGRTRAGALVLFVAQFAVSVYGGYFGAGMGILMLAALGLYGLTDFHERNAVKNLLSATTNGLASIFFASAGAIRWRDGLVLGVGAVAGGLLGAVVGRRLSSRTLEAVAVLVGLVATVSLLFPRH